MRRDGGVLDRLEIGAAGIWLLVALVALGNAGLSLLPGAFLFVWGAIAGLVWLLRSAMLASRPAGTLDHARRLRWYALPGTFVMAFALGMCAVGPTLRLRFALSESALERYRTGIGFRPQFQQHDVRRRVGLFWVWTMWTDGGRCWTFITGYGVESFHGLKYCRPGSWSGSSSVEDLGDGWYSWRASSGIN